jgi:hypothetical protein
VQVTDEVHTIPSQNLAVKYDTVLVFVRNPDCDTASVLTKYGRLLYDANVDGAKWRLESDSWKLTADTLRDQYGKAVGIIDRLKRQNAANVNTAPIVIHDVDTTRSIIVNEYGFFEKIGFAVAFIIAGAVLALFLPALGPIRKILGG